MLFSKLSFGKFCIHGPFTSFLAIAVTLTSAALAKSDGEANPVEKNCGLLHKIVQVTREDPKPHHGRMAEEDNAIHTEVDPSLVKQRSKATGVLSCDGRSETAQVQAKRNVLTFAAQILAAKATSRATEIATVASCPLRATIPVNFVVDCSNIKDANVRQLCVSFIINQACKLFPAYRKITGVKLEQRCRTLTYTIYDKDSFPNGEGVGGRSYGCRIDLTTEHALEQWANSNIGPYEAHEILHHYQMSSKALAAITAAHPLFEISMLEAQREINDIVLFPASLELLKSEIQQLRTQARTVTGQAQQCKLARSVVEGDLYLEDSQIVYQFYRQLASLALNSTSDPETRLNMVLSKVSGRKAKKFLTTHRCRLF